MTATITRDTFEAFRIRNAGEYATICVRSWARAPDHLGHVSYCGEIMIHSSFGNWANQWGSCGSPFPKFLAACDFDYVFTKLLADKLRVYDGDASLRAFKDRLLQARREGTLSLAETRCAWRDLADEHEAVERNVHGLVEAARRVVDSQRTKRLQEVLSEPWEMACTRYDSGAVGFWRDIWPHFIAAYTEKEALPA